MSHADVQAGAAASILHLQETTGIPRRDDLRAGALDVFHFAFEEIVRHGRLNQIVDARAATAPHALGQFSELEIWNGTQDFTRLRRDFLAVTEMTRFVVSDIEWRGTIPLRCCDADL